MDEIRRYCAQMLVEWSGGSSYVAYSWLMECPPFVATLEAMRQRHVTIFELAEALMPSATGELTQQALAVLSEALAKNSRQCC